MKAWAIELNMFRPKSKLASTYFFQDDGINIGIKTALFKTKKQATEAAKRFIFGNATVVRVEVRISIVRKP